MVAQRPRSHQNISYTETSGDMLAHQSDGTDALYNLGDIAFVLAGMALVWL